MRGGHGNRVAPFYLPDGQTLISASVDNSIKLWRLSDGMLLRTTVPFNSGANWPDNAALSNNGSLIAVNGADQDGFKLKIFRTSDGSLASSYPITSFSQGFAFTPDGLNVVLASATPTDPAKLLPSFGGTPVPLSYTDTSTVVCASGSAFLPGGNLAMNRCAGQDVTIYPGTGPWSKDTLISSFGYGSATGPNFVSPDGRFIANVSGLVRIWSTSSGCSVTAQPEPPWTCAMPPRVFEGGFPYGGAIRFSPDSSRMAFADHGTPGGVNFGMYATSTTTT
jgi:hypothetical protein